MQRQDKSHYGEVLANNRTALMSSVFMDIEEVILGLVTSLIVEDDPHNKTIIQGKIRCLQELSTDWKRAVRTS